MINEEKKIKKKKNFYLLRNYVRTFVYTLNGLHDNVVIKVNKSEYF